jgi:hypothetical protein
VEHFPPISEADPRDTGRVPEVAIHQPLVESAHQQDYDALTRELEDAGWTVTEAPRPLEERGVPPEAVEGLLWVAFFLRDHVADIVIDALVASVVRWLRRPRDPQQARRFARIYGPDGTVLRSIPLDDGADT